MMDGSKQNCENNYLIREATDSTRSVNQQIIDESQTLYTSHLTHQMTMEGLQIPTTLIVSEEASEDHVRSLRSLANVFASSPQRQWVHEQAENVELATLNFDTFNELLAGLFQEGGVTWERVLVLFFFCTDLSIRALREKLEVYFLRIYNWTTNYIAVNLSYWVQQLGGWEVILERSMERIKRFTSLSLLCISALVIYLVIKINKPK